MTRFILDYSRPARPDYESRRVRQANRRMWRALRKTGLLLTALVWTTAVVGILRIRAQRDAVQDRHDRQRLQYDSLLATKLAADRRLLQVETQRQTSTFLPQLAD